MLLTITSCKYGVTFSKLKNISDNKSKVEAIYTEDLTSNNQEILRDYFVSIKDLVYEFKKNDSMQNYTNSKFSKFYRSSFCNDGLISSAIYIEIMSKCNVSGFYICSEEVKFYTEMINEASKLLRKSSLSEMFSDVSCKIKLTNLGVVNE
jgi:hypothetical protein